jgi:RimJ/RimL family protein N-acetyltransferase
MSATNIVVRDTSLDDLPHINRIRLHPSIRPHQFQVSTADLSTWEKWIELNKRAGDVWFRCSTILTDRGVIGYVAQTLNFAGSRPFAECGWNLHPDYWSRGIMKIALRAVLSSLFREQDMSYVTADCFRNNTRCKRLLRKLYFSRTNVPLTERMRMAYEYRCLHWIERYRIERETWSVTRENRLDGLH